ncbi:MAG TPA: hypothetical protein VMD91_17835 [Candidatus Sulfotelmatobacter sp.]|nr:hypothetical protein [Candidatus Sulfotelmatobacter sp.]
MFDISKIARALAVSAALTGLIVPAVASAQDVPSYAVDQAPVDQDQTVSGTIASVDGPFDIQVADSNGYDDDVQLHQGTIINPTGLTLEPGMQVSIQGFADGDVFQANEIDTDAQDAYDGVLPTPVYYGPGYWYPGFAYGYGPSFSLAFVFGSGWVHRPFYHVSAWNGQAWDAHAWSGHPWPARYAGRPMGGFNRTAAGFNRPQAFNRYGGFAGNTYRGETRAVTSGSYGYRGETGAYRAQTTNAYRGYQSGGFQAQRGYQAPARSYSAADRSFGGYQGARSYSAPARSYSAPARSYSASARSYSAPARSYGGGGRSYGGGAARGGSGGGDRHH